LTSHSGSEADLPSRDEAEAILRSGFGREILNVAARYVAPIFWGNPASTEDDSVLGNGSIFFIQIGGPVLGVTCDHVVDGWLRAKQARPDIVCQVLDLVIDPESRLIARDPDRDVATMAFTKEEIAALDKWVFTAVPDKWPPMPPQEGKGVFFAGFPNNRVTQIEGRLWEFGIYAGLGVASSVGSDKIVYQYDRQHMIDTLGLGLPPTNEFLGGMSGAALWAVVQSESGLMSWRLAGVIYEWSTDFELLYSRRADVLRSDGTFS